MKTHLLARQFVLTIASAAIAMPAWGDSALFDLHGSARDAGHQPLAGTQIVVHSVADNSTRTAVSGSDGTFVIPDLKPGRYQITGKKAGFDDSSPTTIELPDPNGQAIALTLNEQHGHFFGRLFKAYADDWKSTPDGGPAPAYRGDPMPTSNPPFPFTTWPMGGTVAIGYPAATSYPLTTAIYGSKHADWLKKANIQIYGWVDVGANASTSNTGPYANAPAAYPQVANSVTLDQLTLYIERVPDTVQTDHFDWGFRFTSLYGFDYRFTTADGYFSQQLLNSPQQNGTVGNKTGYDPVMAYVDLYYPKVADGMDVRIGRYISLPDIEAQLAPNNYTYTHSLTYTYDCYTQTGINSTIKLSNHWTVQFGVSGGCEAAPWSPAAKLTGNICAAYSWAAGRDNVYVCANSINDSRYNYNNLAAYYATWYHKFRQSNWHMDWETWYQYQSHTPNVSNPAAASLLITNANGAFCNRVDELTCNAPDWATVHYVNRQFNKRNFISIRNEYMDDMKGQRTGFKTKYSEHALSWNHWIGSTLVFRPELRFDHSYDAPAYDSGTRYSQLMLAADVILFY